MLVYRSFEKLLLAGRIDETKQSFVWITGSATLMEIESLRSEPWCTSATNVHDAGDVHSILHFSQLILDLNEQHPDACTLLFSRCNAHFMHVVCSVSGAELPDLEDSSERAAAGKDDSDCLKTPASVSQASTGEDSQSTRRSGDAVAARNGLWVTLRYRPYCAAAVQPESTT